MANLITSAQNEPHITPKMDSHWHKMLFGEESFIEDGFDFSIITNNEIQIGEGVGSLQGRFFDIDAGTTDTVNFDNGIQGFQRYDIVCYKIEVNLDGTQSGSWVVIKGESAESDPDEPTIPEGNLDAGDSEAYLPVFKFLIDGINLEFQSRICPVYNDIVDNNVMEEYINNGIITG